jgi:hypothetical protein
MQEFPEIRDMVTIIHEEDLLTMKPIEKYRAQMLSKILIAKYVETPHYLILDDDIIASRKFGYSDLFVGKDCKHLRYTYSNGIANNNWWIASAGVLGIEMTPELTSSKTIVVTPEIFQVNATKQLMQKLERLHGKKWIKYLFTIKPRWSEYSLMWLHLWQDGNHTKLYKAGRLQLSDGATNIWFKAPDLKAKLKAMFANKNQYFGVIQSNVNEHEVNVVVEALKSL